MHGFIKIGMCGVASGEWIFRVLGGRIIPMVNKLIRFSLNLTYEQYMAYYEGVAQSVSVEADDGRRIQFPARNIRRYLTKSGIQGYFEMEVTAQNRFIEIRKLD